MNDEKNLQEMRNRLKEVLQKMKISGIKQKQISAKTGIEYTAISHYMSGKIKYIPNEFLEKLHEYYWINPDYIHLKSDRMFDDTGEKYSFFEKIIEEWETVKGDGDEYLYLKMDKNFYDFLIEYDKFRKANDEGIPTGKIEELKAMYEGTPDIEEFVVLPRNVFFEIVRDTNKATKNLAENIDFSEHIAILDEE